MNNTMLWFVIKKIYAQVGSLPWENCFGKGGETWFEKVLESYFPLSEKLFSDQYRFSNSIRSFWQTEKLKRQKWDSWLKYKRGKFSGMVLVRKGPSFISVGKRQLKEPRYLTMKSQTIPSWRGGGDPSKQVKRRLDSGEGKVEDWLLHNSKWASPWQSSAKERSQRVLMVLHTHGTPLLIKWK